MEKKNKMWNLIKFLPVDLSYSVYIGQKLQETLIIMMKLPRELNFTSFSRNISDYLLVLYIDNVISIETNRKKSN